MRVIIAGSRNLFWNEKVFEFINKTIIENNISVDEVVSGKAQGVDALGELWAKDNNIVVKDFPANWDLYGKSAGFRRNTEMSAYSDILILVRLDASIGSTHMLEIAKKDGLLTYVLDLKQEEVPTQFLKAPLLIQEYVSPDF